ncbi:hypothetical protein ASD01_22195 [Ensifer sp. Root423]|nr:hypothetical protein ASD01_22195 [Ensifer sp. Root423]
MAMIQRTHPRWAALSEVSDLALTVLIDVNKDSAEWNGLRLSIAAGGDASATTQHPVATLVRAGAIHITANLSATICSSSL